MEAFDLYEKHGSAGYIGEEVSQLQHAVQAAKQAETFCNNNNISGSRKIEVLLGAFFHDVGHLLAFVPHLNLPKMGDLGILDHEKHGAAYLEQQGYSSLICELVRNHINTKRYLITKDKAYHDKLSEASKGTFLYQGGHMNEDELKAFEANENFQLHVMLREWDDKAKSTDSKDLAITEEYFLKLKKGSM